ncbi:hypothetical protein P692DRAFT_201723434, partial [Suillus brevipes Sb2]
MPQHPEVQCRLIQHSILLVSILISATANILESVYAKDPEPYHTSALSGEAWVIELLTGHPERIRCELGMCHIHISTLLIRTSGPQIRSDPFPFPPYRNWKGFISQNCLFACDFKLNFTYALT